MSKKAKRDEQFYNLLMMQVGRCGICGQPDSYIPPGTAIPSRLAVDHDHTTGRVRGLLCRKCNLAIGLFRDDPKTLATAITYLSETVGQRRARINEEHRLREEEAWERFRNDPSAPIP